MPTERNNNNKSTSTSPNLDDRNKNTTTLNIRQRFFSNTTSTSSTNYPLGISFLSTSTPINERYSQANKKLERCMFTNQNYNQ